MCYLVKFIRLCFIIQLYTYIVQRSFYETIFFFTSLCSQVWKIFPYHAVRLVKTNINSLKRYNYRVSVSTSSFWEDLNYIITSKYIRVTRILLLFPYNLLRGTRLLSFPLFTLFRGCFSKCIRFLQQRVLWKGGRIIREKSSW